MDISSRPLPEAGGGVGVAVIEELGQLLGCPQAGGGVPVGEGLGQLGVEEALLVLGQVVGNGCPGAGRWAPGASPAPPSPAPMRGDWRFARGSGRAWGRPGQSARTHHLGHDPLADADAHSQQALSRQLGHVGEGQLQLGRQLRSISGCIVAGGTQGGYGLLIGWWSHSLFGFLAGTPDTCHLAGLRRGTATSLQQLPRQPPVLGSRGGQGIRRFISRRLPR